MLRKFGVLSQFLLPAGAILKGLHTESAECNTGTVNLFHPSAESYVVRVLFLKPLPSPFIPHSFLHLLQSHSVFFTVGNVRHC